MKKVMSLQQFTQSYQNQNPHDRIEEPKAIRTQWGTLIPMFVGLIAANILSAFHTGPLVAKAYATITGTTENIFMAFIGVLAVEFVVFMLMFISWENTTRKEKLLRVAVILIAIIVSAIANVNATIINLGTSDNASIIAGGLIGVFAPLANLALAEVLRLFRHQAKLERDKIEGDYKAEQKKWDVQMRTRYAGYLKKYGITDPTTMLRLSNGEELLETEEEIPLQPIVRKERVKKQDLSPSYPPRIIELGEKLIQNGDTELGYKPLQQKYGVYPADISKVKRYLEDRPQ